MSRYSELNSFFNLLADCIDEGRRVRDEVYFFGDGEGALVANAVARMIEKVGLLSQ